MNYIDVDLDTGLLQVSVERSDFPLDALCGFAARQNPKRGFLFVSKVLGKHIPVRPSMMRQVNRSLADQIDADLPGPVLFIGMAETAICMGQSVHEEYVRRTGRDDVLFLHSTRYQLSRPLALKFEEEHSHASSHLVYWPEDPDDWKMLEHVRTIVLIDDEASTGNTFVNLIKAITQRFPSISRAVTVVITDWRGETVRQSNVSRMPVAYQSVACLEGTYRFNPKAHLQAVQMPNVVGNNGLKDGLVSGNFGRLGLRKPLEVSLSDRRFDSLSRLNLTPGNRVLVLGTGEFAYPPFLLAEALERGNIDVFCQSTTRSPIREGHAIGSRLEFADNYGDRIPNFIYNARAADYDHVIICHETPAETIDRQLVSELGASLVSWM